jgi:hypothetical protein
LSHLGGAEVGTEDDAHRVEPQYFIEETGKAGVVTLFRLGAPEVLARMVAGDRVYLKVDGFNLVVESSRGEYLGQVEAKHGLRLVRLMQGGNQYAASVVRSTGDMMTVIIREVYQDPSQAERLSFPSRGLESVRPYVSDRMLVREREYEEEAMEEISYDIAVDDDTELLPEETGDIEEKTDNEE